MRRLACSAGVAGAVLALALAGPAVAATPSAGDYESIPLLGDGGTFTYGLFTVAKDGPKRQIVPSEDRSGIYYPDVGKCDSVDLPLAAPSIPISPGGRFKVKERFEVTDSDAVTVSWKGRWRKPKRVTGTITIKSEGCSSTVDWKGYRIP